MEKLADSNSNKDITETENTRKRKKVPSSPAEDPVKKVKISDITVLKEMQNKLSQCDKENEVELELTRQKYFISYFKNVFHKLPNCNNVIDLDTITEDREGFFKIYSVAKMCLSSHSQLKKIIAFNAMYDMFSDLVGKCIHDKIVTPNVKSYVSDDNLKEAFSAYQTALIDEDSSKILELHCVAYLIQIELEKNEPLKIPNPMYNRFSQQMTAISKYVTTIIKGIAKRNLLSLQKPETIELLDMMKSN